MGGDLMCWDKAGDSYGTSEQLCTGQARFAKLLSVADTRESTLAHSIPHALNP
jgi:hypothetical protein